MKVNRFGNVCYVCGYLLVLVLWLIVRCILILNEDKYIVYVENVNMVYF